MIYTSVTMQAEQSYEALTIPLSAMTDKSNDTVFVMDADGIIHLREVKAGADDQKYIEIYEGLEEGDSVIVGNLEGLEDGMRWSYLEARIAVGGEAHRRRIYRLSW